MMLEAALTLADAGYRVHPLYEWTGTRCACPAGEACGEKARGKHPRVGAWQREASSELHVVHGWWRRWPSAGIGIATGPGSGLWVLDLDTPEAVEWYAAQEEKHGEVVTRTIRTGRGAHLWWRWPAGRALRNRQGIVPGVDVRADGGYVIGPPTLHRSGARYEYLWEAAAPLADAPAWLLTLVDPPKVERPKVTKPPRFAVTEREALRHARARLDTDADMRAEVGRRLGGTVRAAARSYVDDVTCPRCGKREVWYYLDEGPAVCHHRNSCGWAGGLYSLARGA